MTARTFPDSGRAARWRHAVIADAVAVVAAGAILAASPVRAEETEGRNLAATCANCHGTDGRAQGAMPVLAGLPAERTRAAFADFRSGKRPATIMHQIAKGYTDAQVATIADYFASRKP